jgi:hypothetical protein
MLFASVTGHSSTAYSEFARTEDASHVAFVVGAPSIHTDGLQKANQKFEAIESNSCANIAMTLKIKINLFK